MSCGIYFVILAILYCKILCMESENVKYEPSWESLDSRPIPSWFDDVKIGIFLHWGVYSVHSFDGEWFWAYWKANETKYNDFMKNYPPNFTYQQFAPDFKAEFFNPDEWADLFVRSGAKYVVLTSKHHEGYTMWPSKFSFGWNSNDVGPHRDLVGDLAASVRKRKLIFGVYYSLYEWYNPLYQSDSKSGFNNTQFVNFKMIPEMHDLINNYEPWVFWCDGDWEAYDSYFKSKEFLTWLYNESPVKDSVVVNDRWGIGIPCQHGDFYSCQDRYNPEVIQDHKWENAMTLDKYSWGYRRNARISDYLTTHELIKVLIETISCGGNILINVGPTKEGTIMPIFEERLLELGEWLTINGEAIYNSKVWKVQNDTLTPAVWYTIRDSSLFACILEWPEENYMKLGSLSEIFYNNSVQVIMVGTENQLEWTLTNGVVQIKLPERSKVKSNWAWVLKIYS